ncbi:hypothetical protein HHI36_017078 [Cryptolaemus montrouzieri]|uniref:Uncharacterized protein n=1 Tax=Cryptolaemus montrouzieri TaxID=559131 RepID=A0ABD2NLF4_9CUCU
MNYVVFWDKSSGFIHKSWLDEKSTTFKLLSTKNPVIQIMKAELPKDNWFIYVYTLIFGPYDIPIKVGKNGLCQLSKTPEQRLDALDRTFDDSQIDTQLSSLQRHVSEIGCMVIVAALSIKPEIEVFLI